MCFVGRGFTPAEREFYIQANGGSKPPPYICDESICKNPAVLFTFENFYGIIKLVRCVLDKFECDKEGFVMKKSILIICIIISLLFLLCGCDIPEKSDESTVTSETEHTHQWQDVSGEHARICVECKEKQLKPEACDLVSVCCGEPMVCTICGAISDELSEDHDWDYSGEDNDCWSTNIFYSCSKCNMQQVTHGDLALPNHIWSEETADGKITFTCTRCKESYTFASEIVEFSYAQVLEEYKIGDPGVKHEHFNNFDIESEITSAIDAVVRAEFELTIEYDTIAVSFDKESDVWCIHFYTSNIAGGDQSVYLNGNGLTCYIVYGE